MTTDPARTEIMVQDDERLLAAIEPIVFMASTRCGLSTEAQKGLAAASIAACKETFPLLKESDDADEDPAVKVIITDYTDRVEVAIEHDGEALPTAGLDTFVGDAVAGSDAGLSGALQKTSVDRVQYETKSGVSRMTLVKYCDGGKKTVA
jgi:hypothetical protein